jgi:hypothetical protein
MSNKGIGLTLAEAKGKLVGVCGSCGKVISEDRVSECTKCGVVTCDVCPNPCRCWDSPVIVERLRSYRLAA